MVASSGGQPERVGGSGSVGGIHGVWVVLEQVRRKTVDLRGSGECFKRGLAGKVKCPRIGAEVVIKGHIFLKDDHDVLDRSLGSDTVVADVAELTPDSGKLLV